MAIDVSLCCTIYNVMHFRGGLFCINIPEDWIKCGVSKHRDRHGKTSVTRGGHAPAHGGHPIGRLRLPPMGHDPLGVRSGRGAHGAPATPPVSAHSRYSFPLIVSIT